MAFCTNLESIRFTHTLYDNIFFVALLSMFLVARDKCLNNTMFCNLETFEVRQINV